MVLRKMRREHGRRVDATGALPMPIDFLQRDDIGVPHLRRDARQIVAAVAAQSELDIVGDEPHRGGQRAGARSLTSRAASERLASFFLALACVSSSMPQSGARISCRAGT